MIVLDSSFLIAFYNESDAHHQTASALMERFVDAALAHTARTRADGQILTFDREFRKLPALRIHPITP